MKHFSRMLIVPILAGLFGGCKTTYSFLDSSARARRPNWQLTQHTPRSQFAALQSHYRPETFDVWSKKLNLLHTGMSREDVTRIVMPREVQNDGLVTSGITIDFIVLDDAYFAGMAVSQETGRMIWVTPPIAIFYDIYPDKSPR
jgi:hypothetical protein